ncbi:MAG: hypothetical protein HeimC3_22120 [Candidatus Heimdallarchaeota archaeon LC_3]|nr:MAG: hypothetical protein HeimC3_22120 [Candidatus Heimdallarchaeota archaeon LC_3]
MIKQNVLFFILTGLFLFSINTNVYVNSGIANPMSTSPVNSVDVSLPTRVSNKQESNINTYHLSTQDFYCLSTDTSVLTLSSLSMSKNENSQLLEISFVKEEAIQVYSS